jgi:hypothetical protein
MYTGERKKRYVDSLCALTYQLFEQISLNLLEKPLIFCRDEYEQGVTVITIGQLFDRSAMLLVTKKSRGSTSPKDVNEK